MAHVKLEVSLSPGFPISMSEVLSDLEEQLLVAALIESGYVHCRAARLLKLNRTTFLQKLHKFGIKLESKYTKNLRKRA